MSLRTAVAVLGLWLAIALVVFSNFCYGSGENLSAAFLPELAKSRAMGRVSGWGWSLGYLGGLLSLGVGVALQSAVQVAQHGLPRAIGITGRDGTGDAPVRALGVGHVLLGETGHDDNHFRDRPHAGLDQLLLGVENQLLTTPIMAVIFFVYELVLIGQRG